MRALLCIYKTYFKINYLIHLATTHSFSLNLCIFCFKYSGMKKYPVTIFLILMLVNCYAQSDLGTLSPEEARALKKNTLIVLLFDSACSYNDVITNAVKENWSFSPFEFVAYKEIGKYFNKEKYAFLMLAAYKQRMEGQTQNSYKDYETKKLIISKKLKEAKKINSYPYIPVGNKEFQVDEEDVICKLSVGIASFAVPRIELPEENISLNEIEYKIPLLVKSMSSYLSLVHNAPEKLTSKDIMEWEKNNYNSTRQKILLILEDDMSKNLLKNKQYEKGCSYKIRLADKNYIQNAIKNNDKTYLFFHLALGDLADVEYFIIDFETGNIVNAFFKGLVLEPTSYYYHIEEHELKVISEEPSPPKGCCGIF